MLLKHLWRTFSYINALNYQVIFIIKSIVHSGDEFLLPLRSIVMYFFTHIDDLIKWKNVFRKGHSLYDWMSVEINKTYGWHDQRVVELWRVNQQREQKQNTTKQSPWLYLAWLVWDIRGKVSSSTNSVPFLISLILSTERLSTSEFVFFYRSVSQIRLGFVLVGNAS